jgi:Fur family ferric uptake transcriptional regulator
VIRASAAQLPEPRRPRRSRQARLVEAALADAEAFLSAQELYSRLRDAGSAVGLSTVYRCLHDLATAGEADVVTSETGEALYRGSRAEHQQEQHRHFLVCRSCGVAVQIVSPTIERWVATTGRDSGYEQLTHRVEIFGVCRNCRSTGAATRAS